MKLSTMTRMGLIGTLLAATGCQQVLRRETTAPRVEHADTTMVIDDAMQIRDWDRSSAYYADTSFVAGPTGFWYQPAYYQSPWVYPVLETPLFVAQTLALPVTLVIRPPWMPVQYAGASIEPTYHAVPPLPPSGGESEEPMPTEMPPEDEPVAPPPTEPSE